MNWRKKIMDQKDLMLIKARRALQSTHALLEKILDDDDDIVLTAKVIGDGEEAMETMTDQQPEEDRIAKIRRVVFERISRLCDGRRSPEEIREFVDQILLSWGMRTPAAVRRQIFEYFRDPRRFYPELPTMCTLADEGKLNRYGEDTVIRLTAIRDIILLIEALRREDPGSDLVERVNRIRAIREAAMYRNEKPVDRMRRVAFAEAERLGGVSAKRLANCFDRIDWTRLRKDRFDELEDLLLERVPSAGVWRKEPTDPVEWQKYQQQSDQARVASAQAKAALWSITRLFESLRGEIATWHHQQAIKAADKVKLERQIAKAQAALAAHSRAA